MITVFLTSKRGPIIIKDACTDDVAINGESDALKVIDRENNVVHLFRWSAVDCVESTEND